jgi:hypothetical protein
LVPPLGRLRRRQALAVQFAHPGGVLRRPDVGDGHRQELLARPAVLLERGVVDLEEAQVAPAVDPLGQRQAVEALTRLLVALRQGALAPSRLGDVGVDGHAAALRQGIEDDLQDASVGQGPFGTRAPAAAGAGQAGRHRSLGVGRRIVAALGQVPDQGLVGPARREQGDVDL